MSTYRLGTVAFAVLGLYWALQACWSLEPVMRFAEHAGTADGRRVLGGIVLGNMLLPIAFGGTLFALREPLARKLFGAEEEVVAGPSLEDLQAVAFSALGVWIAVEGAYRILAVVFPVAVYGDRDSAPWRELAPDLLVTGLAVVLFFKGRVLARLWTRASHPPRDAERRAET